MKIEVKTETVNVEPRCVPAPKWMPRIMIRMLNPIRTTLEKKPYMPRYYVGADGIITNKRRNGICHHINACDNAQNGMEEVVRIVVNEVKK